jgi:hypothetical protein
MFGQTMITTPSTMDATPFSPSAQRNLFNSVPTDCWVVETSNSSTSSVGI